jgi:hypothetical protein
MLPETQKVDIARAQQIWAEYQKTHDVSDRIGQTAAIDPVSGRIWFGESALAIRKQMEAEGIHVLTYLVRVGKDYYYRKGATGGRRRRLLERPS